MVDIVKKLTIVVALVLAPSVCWAQAFEANQFRPSELASDGFAVSTADDLGHVRFGAQLYFDYADDPLGYDIGTESPEVVHQQSSAHLVLSLGLFDRVVVFMGLPYHLMVEEGDVGDGTVVDMLDVRPTGGGLGDLWLGARARLFGERDDVFQIALQATLNVHTASLVDSGQHYLGGPAQSPSLGGHPELFLTLNLGDDVRLSGNVGYLIRNNVILPPAIEVGDQLTFGIGGVFELLDDKLALIAEFVGGSQFVDRQQTPAEALVGAKYHHPSGFSAGVGGGIGVLSGLGAPDFRVFGMLAYTMPGPDEPVVGEDPDRDSDGDGIPDSRDAAPNEPEDKDGFEDEDGAPDPDNDGDGILDVNDGAPNEPEDKDGFEDADGVPDTDNDADGVPDKDDLCPLVAGVAEARGCLDPDSDKDGIPDRVDNCPKEKGYARFQGCLRPQLVEIEYDRLAISKKVFFPTGKAKILSRSFALLANVADVLRNHPEILLVKVEGHADPRGSAAKNLILSRKRAEAVIAFLVKRGIDPERLVPQEMGESKPERPDAVTDDQHLVNRRVQFRIFARTTGEVKHVIGSEDVVY